MKCLLITLLGVLLLGTVSGPKAQAQVAEADSLALVALYTATDGAHWTDNTGWLSNTPCTWYGVSCTADTITELQLDNNNLSGPIPPELSNLANLEVLYLTGNQLSGAIPPALGNLSQLTRLLLEGNPLGGSIPPELGNLTNLEVLILDATQLSGAIPPALGQLSQLRYLAAQINQLSGSIPPELGNLVNLEWVDLELNQLSGPIPAALGQLSRLQFLDLGSNQLSGPIPPELGNPPSLLNLWLHNNQLSGPIPPELGQLSHLQWLVLNNNLFTGTLPLSLTGLTNLSVFLFDNTNLCEPLDAAFQSWLQGVSNVQSTGCTNVATEEAAEVPMDFALDQNYPNPFNPVTTIRFDLPEAVHVRLVVYDVMGREVARLVDGTMQAGQHRARWDASGLPSGVYLYRLTAGAFTETKAMILLK